RQAAILPMCRPGPQPVLMIWGQARSSLPPEAVTKALESEARVIPSCPAMGTPLNWMRGDGVARATIKEEDMFNKAMADWNAFKPSKTLWLWSCVGAAVLTMIVGFTAGGWVTEKTSTEQANIASTAAVAQLAASVCAHR